MPFYEYECTKCGAQEEHLLPMDKRHSKHKCGACGAKRGLKLQISQSHYHDTYSPMHPRRGRGVGGYGRVDPGIGMDLEENYG